MSSRLSCNPVIVGYLFFFATSASLGLGWTDAAELPDCDFIEDSSVNSFKQGYDELLAGASHEALASLRVHRSDSISIQSAWETLVRTLPYDALVTGKRWARPAPRQLQRFLGFIEGRLQLNIPEWWELGLTSVHIRGYDLKIPLLKRPQVELRLRKIRPSLSPYAEEDIELGELRIRAPHGIEISEVPVPLLQGASAKFGNRFGLNIVRISDGSMLVLTHTLLMGSGALARVAVDPYSEVWSRQTHGEFNWGAKFGGIEGRHVTELVVARDTLYIFGIAQDAAYIEGYSLADGKVKLRFSTSY